MRKTGLVLGALSTMLLTACSTDPSAPGQSAGAIGVADGGEGTTARAAVSQSAAATSAAVDAVGTYHFLIPADFNGGIFGVAIDNHVSFVASKDAAGVVSGRFRYVQSAEGEDFIFSGSVTCLVLYDTPVLQRFESIPAMTANRAKWGGVIEKSNDPTLPAGGYIWFQSIDNNSGPQLDYTDVSTLSGFGNQAANEAFCNSPNVPNPNFGPHALGSGNISVR